MSKTNTPAAEPHFFDQDSNCHWYMIPTKHRGDWNDWLFMLDQDPDVWPEGFDDEKPPFGTRMNGIHHINFVVTA
ncbi:MAG: hypothetical protein RLY58_2207 [Pseudomonadota bacterium]|jgi:hypothetical protein